MPVLQNVEKPGYIIVTNGWDDVIWEGKEGDYDVEPISGKVYDWVIHIKGYFAVNAFDSAIGKKFADVRYSAGQIQFRGTPEQLEEFEELIPNTVKVIGSKRIYPKIKSNGNTKAVTTREGDN